MTWEWVTLILGLAGLFIILLGFVTWTNMQVKMSEVYSRRSSEMSTQIQEPSRNG